MTQLMRSWIRETLKIHLGQSIFSGTYGPMLESVMVLLVLWLFCLWMYRRKVFIRV